MKRMNGWLRDGRITGWASLIPLVYFAAEWVVSASWRGHYGYRADVLGPLGTSFCGPAGNWPCSDLYHAMNVALVVTGLAIVVVALGMLVQRTTDRGHAILLLVAGAGLAASGVVTQQVDYLWNVTAISVFMTLGSVSTLFIALSTTCSLTVERRGVAILAAAASLVGYFSYVGNHELLGPGGAQRLAIYGTLIAVIAVGTAQMRRQDLETPERVSEIV